MVKVIILAENLFRDEELFYPMYRMQEEGFDVVVAGPEKTTYKGKFGIPVEALSINSFDPGDIDAVIIPGGFAPDRLRMHDSILNFVKAAEKEGKVVAAICHAGWVLVSANIINGKKVTSYEAIKDDMKNAGGDWKDEEVVVDGKLVTSRKPADLPAFCREIIKLLS